MAFFLIGAGSTSSALLKPNHTPLGACDVDKAQKRMLTTTLQELLSSPYISVSDVCATVEQHQAANSDGFGEVVDEAVSVFIAQNPSWERGVMQREIPPGQSD
jgi:hypothetical protein